MSRLVTLLGYAALVAVAIGLELAARRRRSASFHDALMLALGWRPTRIALLLAWLWLGWHIFVRVDWQ